MNGDVQYWPLFMGWLIVSLLAIFGWKRQALIAAAGMSVVTYTVLSAGLKALT